MGGGAWRQNMCVSRNVYKMVSYTPTLLKKFAARPRGEGLFIAKGEGRKILRHENEISLKCPT